NFTVGRTVTGGTSGARGLILSDSDGGAPGTLTLLVTTSGFVDNETLTDDWPIAAGTALVNGTASAAFTANDIILCGTAVRPSGAALTIGADGQYSYTAS